MSESCLVFDATNSWVTAGIFGRSIALQKNLAIAREASNRLAPLIGELLTEARVERPDWIFCTRGPGSFTGIRICVSTARNLAQLWKIPVLGIDSLIAYFHHCRTIIGRTSGKRVAVLIDGRQNHVYARIGGTEDTIEEQMRLPSLDIAPDIFFKETGRDIDCFADNPEAIRRYAASAVNEEPQDADEWPALRPLPAITADSLYELANLLGGRERAGEWNALSPIYLRTDPAHARYPLGYNPS